MTSRKHRNRARRHAERTMDEAFEALARGERALAEKLSRRAADQGSVNPRLWLDRARIATALGTDDDAIEALETAVELAPSFAEAWLELADLLERRGHAGRARRLRERAAARPAAPAPPTATAPSADPRAERLAGSAVRDTLATRGLAKMAGLLSPAACAACRGLWDCAAAVAGAAVRDDDGERRELRWLATPLPQYVDATRRSLWGAATAIAEEHARLLGHRDRWPAALDDWLDRGRAAGRVHSAVALVRYPRGGFRAPCAPGPRRDRFPLAVEVDLGPGAGEFELADARHGRKLHRSVVATTAGDGVAYRVADRIQRVGGVLGLQPCGGGWRPATNERFVLEIPFDDD